MVCQKRLAQCDQLFHPFFLMLLVTGKQTLKKKAMSGHTWYVHKVYFYQPVMLSLRSNHEKEQP